jgi:hypothetical protein
MREGRAVAGSVDELLAGATERSPLDSNGKSGARLETVLIDGTRYVAKHLDDNDWSTRAAGVPGGAVIELWRRGLLDLLPDCFDQPIVAVSGGAVPALLMRDVSAFLVPDVDEPVAAAQQEQFLTDMAALHAAFWGTREPIDLVSVERRYLELSPTMAEDEHRRGSDHPIPKLVARGWPVFAQVAPKAASVVMPLLDEPAPLVRALAATPQTFVHGNWKFDNLGTDDQGRTVILDWELPGRAAPLSDLAWYLAINCRRLPTGKEAAIDLYRSALERHGIDTGTWWDRQLGLCLLGALVQFGWEKALGGYDDELAWWEEQAVRAESLLAGSGT